MSYNGPNVGIHHPVVCVMYSVETELRLTIFSEVVRVK